MRCGEDGTDCALRHVVPALRGRCTKERRTGGRAVPYQWAARCPVCNADGKLTLTAKGRTLLAFCQKCRASQPDLMAALAKEFPDCFGVRPVRRGGIAAADLVALALAPMPPLSRQLAMLEMAGMSTPDALDKLGVSRQNRYRVVAGRASFVVAGATPE